MWRDEVEAASVRYLEEAAQLGTPWFLCSSFIAPHWPYVVPDKYWDACPRELVDVPHVPDGHLESQHPVIRQLRAALGVDGYSEEVVRRARAAYLGLVMLLDERIGRLLDTLDRTGQRENTVVIYVSDHGGMLGEHGLWRKANFYEESVRVPLLVRWPAGIEAGGRVRDLVSLVDIAPTLTGLAGGPRLPGGDGADLLPVVRGEQRRETVFSEYLGPGVSAPMAMLRRADLKLNYYHGHSPELFDLAVDPAEFHDVSEQPDYAPATQELTYLLLKIWDPVALNEQVCRSQQERALIVRAGGFG
jgi:choline-sulfatase